MSTIKELPPKVKGLPIVGSILDATGDIASFYTKIHREYGEIKRVQLLHNEVFILSGVDVNNWFSENQHLFSIREGFQSFEWIWGTENLIVLQDGEAHRKIRSTLRSAMATSAVTKNFDLLRDYTNRLIRSWDEGQDIGVWDWSQRFATQQLTLLVTDRVETELFAHFRRLITWQLYVDFGRILPKWVLQLPQYQNTVKHLRTYFREMIADARKQRASDDNSRRLTLVDDLLDAQAEDPEFWTDEAIVAGLGVPFLAGMDTVASTLSFFLYEMMKNPDALAACVAEVDAFYEETDGDFGYHDMRSLQKVAGAIHETLRLHSVGIGLVRSAREDFEYAGYHVPAGSNITIATVVPHLLEEYYPNPEKFDIYRDMKPPVKGVFNPFGLGSHTCLGAGFGQAQLLSTVVLLLRQVEFEMVEPDFEAKIQSTPVPNVGFDFKVRIKRFRN